VVRGIATREPGAWNFQSALGVRRPGSSIVGQTPKRGASRPGTLGERFPFRLDLIPAQPGHFSRWKNQALELECRKISLKRLQSETCWVKYEVQQGLAVPGPSRKRWRALGKPKEFRGLAERDTTPIDLTPAAMLGGGARRVSLLARPERRVFLGTCGSDHRSQALLPSPM